MRKEPALGLLECFYLDVINLLVTLPLSGIDSVSGGCNFGIASSVILLTASLSGSKFRRWLLLIVEDIIWLVLASGCLSSNTILGRIKYLFSWRALCCHWPSLLLNNLRLRRLLWVKVHYAPILGCGCGNTVISCHPTCTSLILAHYLLDKLGLVLGIFLSPLCLSLTHNF